MADATAEFRPMRRFAVVGVAVSIGVLAFAPSGLAASARVAALQIGLRAHGFDPGPVDGVRGQLTTGALIAFQRARGSPDRTRRPRDTARARAARPAASRTARARRRRRGLGRRGARVPARRYGLGVAAVDGRFTRGDGRRAAPLPESRGSSRTASPGPRTFARSPVMSPRRPDARRPAGRELLLDRGALSRQPLAARSTRTA